MTRDKRHSQFNKIMVIGLLALLIIQFLVLVYCNLRLNVKHMDFDSSWVYLKTALVWKEKRFISSNWSETTNPFLDLSLPLASLIYGITGKLFFSYGVATLTVLLGILASVFFILKRLSVNKTGILVALNLVICPFLIDEFDQVVELGYCNSVLVGPAHYNLRTLIVLLIILEYLNIQAKKKNDFMAFLSIALCFVSGMSSGVYLIAMIILPMLLYIVEIVFIDNKLKVFLKKESIYTYICLLFVILGKLYASIVLRLEIHDSENNWTSIENFWKNFGAPFQGLLKLLKVFSISKTDVSVFSVRGIISVFPLFILFVIILAFVFASVGIYKKIKDKADVLPETLFFINVIVVHFLMFGFMNGRYGLPVFEERYLIPAIFMFIILTGIFVRNLKADLLISRFLIIGLFISISVIDIISDKNYIGYSNYIDYMFHLRGIAEREDAGLVYFWGPDIDENVRWSCLWREMRAFDVDRVYKWAVPEGAYVHWGDYLYYEDNSEYEGNTLLIANSNQIDTIRENIFAQLELIEDDGRLSIYKCNNNPIDYSVGISGDISVDYPTTYGMFVQNSVMDENSVISDGTEGYVMFGPYTDTPDGTYDFVLEYSLIEGEDAYFDVLTDFKDEQGIAYLSPDENKAVIDNVDLNSGHKLEYRVFCGEGTRIKIDKITIIKDVEKLY